MIDAATYSISNTYKYDAYGNQEVISETDTNPFRYSGEYYDSETGFIYLRARYYDSTTGTFISEDPARDGINWYAYCAGNPMMYVDTSGMAKSSDNETLKALVVSYRMAIDTTNTTNWLPAPFCCIAINIFTFAKAAKSFSDKQQCLIFSIL